MTIKEYLLNYFNTGEECTGCSSFESWENCEKCPEEQSQWRLSEAAAQGIEIAIKKLLSEGKHD